MTLLVALLWAAPWLIAAAWCAVAADSRDRRDRRWARRHKI